MKLNPGPREKTGSQEPPLPLNSWSWACSVQSTLLEQRVDALPGLVAQQSPTRPSTMVSLTRSDTQASLKQLTIRHQVHRGRVVLG